MPIVVNRNGQAEEYDRTKLYDRLVQVAPDLNINVERIVAHVDSVHYDQMTTAELDATAVEHARSLFMEDRNYLRFAMRLHYSNLARSMPTRYVDRVNQHPRRYASDYRDFINEHADEIERIMGKYNCADTFATLFALNDTIVRYAMDGSGAADVNEFKRQYEFHKIELPSDVYMRQAVETAGGDLARIEKTYEALIWKKYVHASPTIFHAGTPRRQVSSCFLLASDNMDASHDGYMLDTIEGEYDAIGKMARMMKRSGGIGITLSSIREKGATIASTGGVAQGVVAYMRVIDQQTSHIRQGPRRNGACAVFLDVWHAEIEDFIDARMTRVVNMIHLGVLFNDLFFERVRDGKSWTLFSPADCGELADVHGDEFRKLYEQYEDEGRGTKTIDAFDLFVAYLKVPFEAGEPYAMNRDAMNRLSTYSYAPGQMCKGSNLCVEIIQPAGLNRWHGTCTLSSISIKAHVRPDGTLDYAALGATMGLVVRNLDTLIDSANKPTPESEAFVNEFRDLGIGVQGFADALTLMGIPYDSPEALQVNYNISEVMAYYGWKESVALARERGAFPGLTKTWIGQGVMPWQLHLRHHGLEAFGSYPCSEILDATKGLDGDALEEAFVPSSIVSAEDWKALRSDMRKYGARNAQLTSRQPTASSSFGADNTESTEPHRGAVYLPKTEVSQHSQRWSAVFLDILEQEGLYGPEMLEYVRLGSQDPTHRGCIGHLAHLPQSIRDRFKTAMDVGSFKVTIDHAAAAHPFICQSQSMSLHGRYTVTHNQLKSAILYGQSKHLKTLAYYARIQAPPANHHTAAIEADAQDTTAEEAKNAEILACSRENPEMCMMCQ